MKSAHYLGLFSGFEFYHEFTIRKTLFACQHYFISWKLYTVVYCLHASYRVSMCRVFFKGRLYRRLPDFRINFLWNDSAEQKKKNTVTSLIVAPLTLFFFSFFIPASRSVGIFFLNHFSSLSLSLSLALIDVLVHKLTRNFVGFRDHLKQVSILKILIWPVKAVWDIKCWYIKLLWH